MTAVLDAPATDANESTEASDETSRDFTKHRPSHEELAEFVNTNADFVSAGLDKVSAGQVKAILALRTAFSNTPEQAKARADRKAKREAEKAEYEGLTDEQIKVAKVAQRAADAVAKQEARLAEAREKATKLKAATSLSGDDLAAAVKAAQGDKPAKKEAAVSEDESDASPKPTTRGIPRGGKK